ncbi:MAG: glycosyltransferase family 39 protein [Parcubacteria group bacterium]|jgi:4-amino-4-deoxy-L-arabinose transferase-like glycosyltransferase
MFSRNKNFLFKALIILIIAGGVFIRFWHLDSIPPGIHYDEAYNGVNALTANETHNWKIFYEDNTGREGLHINVIAFFISIFGNNNFGLRFANALWGSLTLIGFYFLLKELKFSHLSRAIGTFMIATSFWHLVFSRTAYRAIMVPLILVWLFYFFWKAVDTPKYRTRYFIISGLLLGIGFHTYISFRIAPVIILAVALSFVLTRPGFLARHWKSGLIFAIAALLAALPIFIFFSDHFKDFVSRSEAVSVFNAPNMTFWQAFGKSLGRHLWAFFVIGDHNYRHNFNNQPLLPAAWSVLFAIGFIISIREIGKTAINLIKNSRENPGEKSILATRWFNVSVLAQSIFWIMILPGTFSIEGIPHSLRIIGTIPAVFIFCVLPFEYITSLFTATKEISISATTPSRDSRSLTVFIGLIAMVVLGGLSQVYIYFNLWATDLATMGAYERKLYDFGLMTKDLPVRNNNYIMTAWNTAIYSDRHQSSLKTLEYLAYPNIKKYLFYRPTDGIGQINCDDPQIVFLESDQWLRDQYKNNCPSLQQKRYLYNNGKYTFWVMSNNP